MAGDNYFFRSLATIRSFDNAGHSRCLIGRAAERRHRFGRAPRWCAMMGLVSRDARNRPDGSGSGCRNRALTRMKSFRPRPRPVSRARERLGGANLRHRRVGRDRRASSGRKKIGGTNPVDMWITSLPRVTHIPTGTTKDERSIRAGDNYPK